MKTIIYALFALSLIITSCDEKSHNDLNEVAEDINGEGSNEEKDVACQSDTLFFNFHTCMSAKDVEVESKRLHENKIFAKTLHGESYVDGFLFPLKGKSICFPVLKKYENDILIELYLNVDPRGSGINENEIEEILSYFKSKFTLEELVVQKDVFEPKSYFHIQQNFHEMPRDGKAHKKGACCDYFDKIANSPEGSMFKVGRDITTNYYNLERGLIIECVEQVRGESSEITRLDIRYVSKSRATDQIRNIELTIDNVTTEKNIRERALDAL